MEIINRKMEAEKNAVGENYMDYQASFNSDGVLTLRNRSHNRLDEDVIIVLSRKETDAIFELFRQIKTKFNLPDLPF